MKMIIKPDEFGIGINLRLQLSEPIEIVNEVKPNPLIARILQASTVESRLFLTVSTKFVFEQKNYSTGLIRNRYSNEKNVLELLSTQTAVMVNASFLPIGHRYEEQLLTNDTRIIQSLSRARGDEEFEWTAWFNFIGSISLF